jgi:hypothetical protein
MPERVLRELLRDDYRRAARATDDPDLSRVLTERADDLTEYQRDVRESDDALLDPED